MMVTVDQIRLTLEPPMHGWLPTKLELGDFIVDCVASNVLNDPVEEFLEALAFCNTPTHAGYRVCLWMEPAGYAIDVAACTTPGRCILRVFFNDSFVPPMRSKKLTAEYEAEVDTIRVTRAISAAFGRLLIRTNIPALEEWRAGQTYLQRFVALREARRAKSRRTG